MYFIKWYAFFLLIIFMGCKNDQTTEYTQSLSGLYFSTTFIEPGAADGGIDLITAGGYLNIIFQDNSNFAADLFIPEKIGSNFSSGNTQFLGKYIIKADTVFF